MKRSASIAASLFAIVATASCTSSGPPMDVGVGDPQATTSTDPATVPPVATASTTTTTPPAVVADGSAGTVPQGDGGPVAAISTPSRIQFAPIVGSTVEAATPLTQELAKRARERGIGIAGSGGIGATHILKGYFSAMSEGGSTTVIYVWDVLDPAGNRLHRIQGQAKADGKGDGWSAVPTATMQAIADHTIDEFALWLSTRTG
jgi:hypothetical protein